MPDGISFGARTMRQNNYVGVAKEGTATGSLNHLGPGAHLHEGVTSSFNRARPAFAAFGATSERSYMGAPPKKSVDAVPGPGQYLGQTVKEPSAGNRAREDRKSVCRERVSY